MIKMFINIGFGKSADAKYSILIGFIFTFFTLKFGYVYFNIFYIPIIVISSFLILKTITTASSKKQTILKLISTICVLVCFIPDRAILRHFNSDNGKLYASKIDWSYFEGEPIDTSEFAAVIYTFNIWKVNQVFNYPQAIMVSKLDPKSSWVEEDQLSNMRLLNHEQGHFNITEIHTRKAEDSISKAWGNSANQIESIIEFYVDQKDKMQTYYDKTTNHGLDTILQQKWNRWFNLELKRY